MINDTTNDTIAGEYYLTGMMEMASAFLLIPDGTFQFFFTYGALDRYGSGRWEINGDDLLLTSAAPPEADFTLVKSSKQDHDFIQVQMEDADPLLMRHVYCSLDKGQEGTWHQLDHEGAIQLQDRPVTDISLLLEFCAERFSTIPVSDPFHNDFTFRFNETIMEVFVKSLTLKVRGKELNGGHPLLQGNEFRYQKAR